MLVDFGRDDRDERDRAGQHKHLPPIPAPSPAVAPAPSRSRARRRTGRQPAPVKQKKHKAAPRPNPLNEPTVTLVARPGGSHRQQLNVRGQAGLKGEVVTHLNKGDTVTVLGQINLDKHTAGEPAQWAKIALPVEHARLGQERQYIDATSKTVSPKKLNLRAGPGENYSVLGVIERGTPVNEITTKGDWMKIEPPANAYAFVAAMYLKQEAPAPLATRARRDRPARAGADTGDRAVADVAAPPTPPAMPAIPAPDSQSAAAAHRVA